MKDQNAMNHNYYWGYKLVGAGTLGLTNATLVTPLMNIANQFIDRLINSGKTGYVPMDWNKVRFFDGLASYNTAVVLMVGSSIVCNDYLLKQLSVDGKITNQQKLFVSVISGAIAGSFGSVFEAIAQTQQLNKANPKPMLQVVKDVYKNNGLFALNRGLVATSMRSAGFTMGYLGLMPLLSEKVRQMFGEHVAADLFAAIACGSLVGTATAPLNTLRFRKQEHFSVKGAAPTYTGLLCDAMKSPKAVGSLFAGLQGRVPATVFSMFFLSQGNKLLKQCLDGDMASPRLK